MDRTFQEIIEMMELAEDYGDLYSAAACIKNQDLRVDVEQMIGEYEDDDTPVDVAYFCVTSDLLDEYMYEDNVEDLGDYAPFYPRNKKSESKKVTEGIKDEIYEVADLIAEKIRLTGNDSVSMEEFDEIKDSACKELGVENYNDLDADLRGILSYKGFDTNFETGELLVMNEGKLFKVTIDTPFGEMTVDQEAETQEDANNTAIERVKGVFSDKYKDKVKLVEKKISPEDEAWFEEENDKMSRQEIEDKLKDGKQEPDEEIEKEIDKVTEGKEPTVESIKEWSKSAINDLVEMDEGCCEYKLDDNLSIFAGWSGGYDPKDISGIHSNTDPTFCINIGIKCNHEYMKTDYDWLNYPYNKETGEVYDTGLTVDEGGLDDADAQWLIDSYKDINEELDSGELILEGKKIIENVDTLNNDEEDLASYLYANAMYYASFDGRTGKCDDYELDSLEDVQYSYDEDITKETYNKVSSTVKKIIDNAKYYNNSDSPRDEISIELNDNHTLYNIDIPEGFESDSFYENTYVMLVNEAVSSFKEKTGIELKLLGRSGRHACVDNTFENACRYDELKSVQEELEKDLIQKCEEYMKASMGENVEESKKVEESDEQEVDFDTFTSNLEKELKDNGYTVELGNIDENLFDASAEKDGKMLGICIYKGAEDSNYGFEKDTIGLGGDCVIDTVYPIYTEGWDFETASPKNTKPETGTEVYSMFKELNNVTVNQVVEVVNKSFEAANTTAE